jgi:hypothetical protein
MKYTINEILHLIFKDVEGKPFNDYTFTIDDVDDEGGSLTLVAPTNTPAGTVLIVGLDGAELIRNPDNTYSWVCTHIDDYQEDEFYSLAEGTNLTRSYSLTGTQVFKIKPIAPSGELIEEILTYDSLFWYSTSMYDSKLETSLKCKEYCIHPFEHWLEDRINSGEFNHLGSFEMKSKNYDGTITKSSIPNFFLHPGVEIV